MFVFCVHIVSRVCFRARHVLLRTRSWLACVKRFCLDSPQKDAATDERLRVRSALLHLLSCSALVCCTPLTARARAEVHDHEPNDTVIKMDANPGRKFISAQPEAHRHELDHARKLSASLSCRVTTRRKYLNLMKKRSTWLRSR